MCVVVVCEFVKEARMTTTAKEKVQVDHSAINKPPADKPGGFMEGMKSALNGAGIKTEESKPASTPAPAKSILSNIHKGRSFSPPRIMLVGTEGIGKSTWAASAPSPILIPTEDGLDQIDCEKFTWPDPTAPDGIRKKANSYEEVIECVDGLATQSHTYKWVVIDSVDWLEKLIWMRVCRRFNKKNIQDIGYAKGFDFALDEWREVLEKLSLCRGKGMGIITVAHAKIDKFEDPELPAYDRYTPKLHKHAAALLKEWSDCVLFASYRRTVKLVEGKGTDERAIGTHIGANGGDRIIRTVASAVCDAKNRYNLPPEIPLSWEAFAEGLGKFMTSSNVA